jgi:tRNA G18 (ribose-2'-O)-methylase SpoU
MVTDRYQHVRHVPDVPALLDHAKSAGYQVVAIDNTAGARPLETAELPRRALFLFGQEGPGLSEPARAAAALTLSIAQFGSTRSINAGVAAGIAMHAWIRQHAVIDNVAGS